MHHPHAAHPPAVAVADEGGQRLARIVAAQAVQVDLALDAPVAPAQLPRHVQAHARAAVAQGVVHVQQGRGVELVGQGLLQHALLVQLLLHGHRRRQLARVFHPAMPGQRLHRAGGALEQVALGVQPARQLAPCGGLGLLALRFLTARLSAAARAAPGEAVAAAPVEEAPVAEAPAEEAPAVDTPAEEKAA